MKHYLSKYRPFLLFLAKFFISYSVLALLYHGYISSHGNGLNQVDPLTISVSEQSVSVLRFFDIDATAEFHPLQPTIKLLLNGHYVARIIEGCNAISVMILFIAFIVAFSGKVKSTIIYCLAGCFMIHILNIARIALLSIALYRYPQYEHILHGVVFPLFIYGVVFILWVIWVNKYSYYASPAR